MADVGTISWMDLTVDDADGVRDFYEAVTGWKPEAVGMGDYNDYAMAPPNGDAVAGICHARGSNADLPPAWLIYIVVESVDNSIAECRKRGGAVVVEPRGLAGGTFCVIRDPAGAVCALWSSGDT